MRDERRYITVTSEMIDDFVRSLEDKELSHITVRKYNRVLRQMYEQLPEDKKLYKDSYNRAMAEQIERYSNSTVQSTITAFNQFVTWLGYADFRMDHLEAKPTESPELTREEYLRMLFTARREQKYAEYMLIKLFANIGIKLQDLRHVTMEAIRAGYVMTDRGEELPLPESLQQELLRYAASEGTAQGMLFVTSSGKVLDRHRVTRMIAEIGRAAELPEGKANPRALHKMHVQTSDKIKNRYREVILHAYDNLMENEEALVRWIQPNPVTA